MIIRYWEPLGHIGDAQDSLPSNWERIQEEQDAYSIPNEFSQVIPGVFRSSLPWRKQLTHLESEYGIKHVISLLDGDWLSGDYDLMSRVDVHQFPIYQRRHLTKARVEFILEQIDRLRTEDDNSNILIHCLKGRVRTGMVSAALQLSEGYSMSKVIFDTIKHKNVNHSALMEIFKY